MGKLGRRKMNAFVEEAAKLFFKDDIKIENMVDKSRQDEERYIYFIKQIGKRFALKIYSNSYTSEEVIISWSRLSNLYYGNGIVTTRFLKSINENQCEKFEVDGKIYWVWLEEYVESKYCYPNEIDLGKKSTQTFYSIGKIKGKMHQLAKQNFITCEWVSPWRLFEAFLPSETYDENYENALNFYENGKKVLREADLVEEVWGLYNEKREELKQFYSTLPSGQVQGDFSPSNFIVSKQDEIIGIYDYNLSGRDAFISDCIQEGVFLAYENYEEDLFGTKYDKYLNERFHAYVEGYMSEYTMSKDEFEAANLLYNIARPMRMEKIQSFLIAIKEGNETEVHERLLWMHRELKKDFFVEI